MLPTVTTLDWANAEGSREFRLGNKFRRQPQPSGDFCPLFSIAKPTLEMINRFLARCNILVKTDSHIKQFTTRELLDMAVRLDEDIAASEEAIDHFEGWFSNAEEWTEIARGLWLPSELVPQPDLPGPFRVRPIQGSHSWQHGDSMTEIVEADESSSCVAIENRLVLPDPPVEREPDASVRWIHTLRTIHLHSGYLPVPTGARFRYPRFVGRTGPLAISTVIHET